MGGTYNKEFVEGFPRQFMEDIRRIITDHPLRNDVYEGDLMHRVWWALERYVPDRAKYSSMWMYGNTDVEGHRLSDLHALCAGILIGRDFSYNEIEYPGDPRYDEYIIATIKKYLISIEYSWF